MAEISAKLVMELRKKTGAGMMECKKALVSANGDFDEAIKLIASVMADAVLEGKQGEQFTDSTEEAPAEAAE